LTLRAASDAQRFQDDADAFAGYLCVYATR
jgi:hypothetical protein